MTNHSSPPFRILDLQWRDMPNGHEYEAVFEMTQSDGSKALRREFWQHVDLGDSYVTLRHAARHQRKPLLVRTDREVFRIRHILEP